MVQLGRCIIGQLADRNCKTFNGRACIQCFPGFYINQVDQTCKRLNPLCKTSNYQNGACLSCYPGYALNPNTGACQVSVQDSNCK